MYNNVQMHFLVKKKSVGIFNGLYLFNLYPITNWPFRLNPSPCPWPFPIDGYKKRVMLGFFLSLNTWWRCRCGRWSCGTSSGRSQSQCARLPPALLALARRGSAAGDDDRCHVCLRRLFDREQRSKIAHWQGALCHGKRTTYEFVEEFCGALHRHTSSHGNCFHRAITLRGGKNLCLSVFMSFCSCVSVNLCLCDSASSILRRLTSTRNPWCMFSSSNSHCLPKGEALWEKVVIMRFLKDV